MWRKTPIGLTMLDVMWIVAFSANKPALGSGTSPFTNPLAMNTFPPVPIDLTVAFTTQLLRLVETDRFVSMIDQLVALSRVMAIQAPDIAPTVRQFG
jgi:hypothetical protein